MKYTIKYRFEMWPKGEWSAYGIYYKNNTWETSLTNDNAIYDLNTARFIMKDFKNIYNHFAKSIRIKTHG